jgi:hypothetical protein
MYDLFLFVSLTSQLFLHALFSQWVPVGPSVLNVVCTLMPSPDRVDPTRVRALMFGTHDPAVYSDVRISTRASFSLVLL